MSTSASLGPLSESVVDHSFCSRLTQNLCWLGKLSEGQRRMFESFSRTLCGSPVHFCSFQVKEIIKVCFYLFLNQYKPKLGGLSFPFPLFSFQSCKKFFSLVPALQIWYQKSYTAKLSPWFLSVPSFSQAVSVCHHMLLRNFPLVGFGLSLSPVQNKLKLMISCFNFELLNRLTIFPCWPLKQCDAEGGE